jgi:FkbM family methyltransferase
MRESMDTDLKMFSDTVRKRILLTVSCRDCDYIPKHAKAGRVEYDGISGREVQYMFNGLKVTKGCYEGDWMTYVIDKLNGHHEPQEEKVFHEVLKRIPFSGNNMIFELGAHWAYYSMWFVKQAGGRAVLIEPNTKKMGIGVDNFALNKLECRAFNGFVGTHHSHNDIFIDWDSTIFFKPRYSVDYMMRYLDVKGNLTLLHSDIQGAEYDMLLGAENTLKNRRVDYIFISTHNDRVHKSCLDKLAGLGYNIIAAHNVKESFSADGLIAASAPAVEKFHVEITKR